LGILLLLIIEEPNNSDVVKQILLIAGIFPNIGIGYVHPGGGREKAKDKETISRD
jgi:hypothetical protein